MERDIQELEDTVQEKHVTIDPKTTAVGKGRKDQASIREKLKELEK